MIAWVSWFIWYYCVLYIKWKIITARAKYFLKNCSRLLNPIPRRSITLKLLTLSREACWYMYIYKKLEIEIQNFLPLLHWQMMATTTIMTTTILKKKINRLNNFYYADFCVKFLIFNWFFTVIVHQNFESQSSI